MKIHAPRRRRHRRAGRLPFLVFESDDALIFCTAKSKPLNGVNLVRREFQSATVAGRRCRSTFSRPKANRSRTRSTHASRRRQGAAIKTVVKTTVLAVTSGAPRIPRRKTRSRQSRRRSQRRQRDDRSCRQPHRGQPVRCRRRRSPRLAAKPTSTQAIADAHEACGRPESKTRPQQ
jgi:hypothetical protein